MLIVLIVFGIVLMTAVGLVLARRRPRVVTNATTSSTTTSAPSATATVTDLG